MLVFSVLLSVYVEKQDRLLLYILIRPPNPFTFEDHAEAAWRKLLFKTKCTHTQTLQEIDQLERTNAKVQEDLSKMGDTRRTITDTIEYRWVGGWGHGVGCYALCACWCSLQWVPSACS